jgi:hypothetical protein
MTGRLTGSVASAGCTESGNRARSSMSITATTANQGLTYDAASGKYNYVWKTQKSWGGTCRQFTLRLTDGTDHIALFKFK